MNLAQVDPQRRVSVAEDAITAADAAHQRQCRRPPVLSARDALTALQFEALLVSVAACNVISGEELTEDDDVDATNVEVLVRHGEVILSGRVADRQMKRAAEDAAERVAGVRDVQNQLRVEGEKNRGNQFSGSTVSRAETETPNRTHRA